MLYARSVLRNRLDFKRLRLQIKILILKFYFLPFTKWRVQLKELSVHGISFNIMFTHLNFHKREICRSQIILTGSGKYNRLWKSINPAEMDQVLYLVAVLRGCSGEAGMGGLARTGSLQRWTRLGNANSTSTYLVWSKAFWDFQNPKPTRAPASSYYRYRCSTYNKKSKELLA